MKKLVVLSMLILAAFLAACGGGVATVAPPEQTQNYQHALETANAPTVEAHTEVATESGESQGGEVTATEPTLPPTTVVAPTEAVTATDLPTEIATEIVTEAPTPTEEVTEISPTTEVPTQLPTIAPTEPPTTEPTIAPTLEPSEVPSEVPTEEGGTGGVNEQTATLPPTETAVPSPTVTQTATTIPTDTPAPTDTPLPTNTATPIPTDTLIPTSTATLTATPVPSNTATPIPTDTLVPTDTPSATPTFTPTVTLPPSETPIPTNTPFVPPQEFTTYTSEELHLSVDYPVEWSEPVYDEPFLLIGPDGTTEVLPAAAITRGSADYFADELGVEDISSPQSFLEALAETEGNAEVSKVSGYSYPAFELITSDDEIAIRGLLFVVNDNDWIFFIGAAHPEVFDLFSETTFQQMAMSVVAESIEPTATPSPIPTNTPRPTATLPPTWTPTATAVPILGEVYEDEDAGFAFSYPEGAEVSVGENEVTIAAEVQEVPGEIYFVRGRPEELAEQGIICESRDPVEALRCINPAVEPTYTGRYEKFGSPAWFTVQNVEADGQINAVVSYVVAAGPEWIYIRLTAPASDYTTANLQLFQPILDSVFIEVQPTPVFGRWGLR
ncbi:MAG: hypothetical protein K8L91_21630 [Anaerolineae bacterium]|nr:hypothetical protein [Anaerolineae bacterium]